MFVTKIENIPNIQMEHSHLIIEHNTKKGNILIGHFMITIFLNYN